MKNLLLGAFAFGLVASSFAVTTKTLKEMEEVRGGATYKTDTYITGTGGFIVKDGGVLAFNESATFDNDFSGGIEIEPGGYAWCRQYGVKGTPYGTGDIIIRCDGTKKCYLGGTAIELTQKVTTTGDSTAQYPVLDSRYTTFTLNDVEVGGDVYLETSYADAKNKYWRSAFMKFNKGLDATGHDIGFNTHGTIAFDGVIKCDNLIGNCMTNGTETTILGVENGRLGGIYLNAANNVIGAIRLDSQAVSCNADHALAGASLRFEGQHACQGPDFNDTTDLKKNLNTCITGYLDLNSKDDAKSYTQTVKWVESDARARSQAVGYIIQNSKKLAGTLVISGEANKTATAYVALNGKVNLTIDSAAPATFRQVFVDRESTMTGAIAVNGGTLEFAGEATFDAAASLAVGNGATVVVSTEENPFGDYIIDLRLATGATLVLPAEMSLKVKSVSLDGELLPAGSYTTAELPGVSGGVVESATGADVTPETITWTAGDTDDSTDAARAANWGRETAPTFGLFKYIPVFATAGDTAVFSGRNRFAGVQFDRAGGFAVDGANGTEFLVNGAISSAAATEPTAYAVKPRLSVIVEDTVTAGANTDLRFEGGVETSAKLTKVGDGDLTLAGTSTLGGDIGLDKGRLVLSGTVEGEDASVRFRPVDTGAILVLSNATVGANIVMSGGSVNYNFELGAGTTNTLTGKFTQSGSLSIYGGGVLYFRGGGYVVNKLYVRNDAECHVCDVPWTASYGGFQAWGGNWVFDVAGNTIGTTGGLLLMQQSGRSISFTVSEAFNPAVSNNWEANIGTFELNSTTQTVKQVYSGTDSKGTLWTDCALNGSEGSLLRLTGPYTEATYQYFGGKINGALSLDFNPCDAAGVLTLESVKNARPDGACTFLTTGSLTVGNGELILENTAMPDVSGVTLEGGTLTVGVANAFGKKSAPLYVKDGLLKLAANTVQSFSAAYLWNPSAGSYEKVPDGVYAAGGEGLAAHISGEGKVKVGKTGMLIMLR